LHTLDLSDNKLASLPGTIINLEALSDLNLSCNRETDLDGNLKLAPYLRLVTALTGLTRLDLGGMSLESLPDSIGNLINLTELDLASNRLKQVPDSISKLKNLIILNLHSNCLTSLPSTLGELKELRKLYLPSNRLATLPDSVNGLTNLTSLWLEWNPLNEGLPATLCQCTNLKDFGLTDYQLKALSPEIQAFDKFVYKVK
jgi:Leucine-rich repeat (LRR) protein